MVPNTVMHRSVVGLERSSCQSHSNNADVRMNHCWTGSCHRQGLQWCLTSIAYCALLTPTHVMRWMQDRHIKEASSSWTYPFPRTIPSSHQRPVALTSIEGCQYMSLLHVICQPMACPYLCWPCSCQPSWRHAGH